MMHLEKYSSPEQNMLLWRLLDKETLSVVVFESSDVKKYLNMNVLRNCTDEQITELIDYLPSN